MKLMLGRKYKKDLSDIVGIIYEQERAGYPLNFEMIDKAVCNLYGGWENISKDAQELLHKLLESDDLEKLFIELSEDEVYAKEALVEMEKKYPNVVKKDNVDDVILELMKKKKRTDREER